MDGDDGMEDSGPGVVISLNALAMIHAILGLLSVANIHIPPGIDIHPPHSIASAGVR